MLSKSGLTKKVCCYKHEPLISLDLDLNQRLKLVCFEVPFVLMSSFNLFYIIQFTRVRVYFFQGLNPVSQSGIHVEI